MELITNILIIGKSGAGKSSLLNYLFGRQLEKTGTGKPVTEEGIFCHNYEIEDGFKANIYDTFGLEPGKTEQWRTMIREEIAAHDASAIQDWFHMIIYCFNANVARIEGFEVDILKSLVEEGNHVLIVFTHCDLPETRENIEKIKPRFVSLGIAEDNIICVCNEEKHRLDGTITLRFGREEILMKAKEAFFEKLVRRIPVQATKTANEYIDTAVSQCNELAKKEIKIYNIHSNKHYQKINDECNAIFTEAEEKIRESYIQIVQEAMDYYVQLCGKFLDYQTEATAFDLEEDHRLHYVKKMTSKLSDGIAIAVFVSIPLVQFLVPSALVSMHRKAYMEAIAETAESMREQVRQKEDEIRRILARM